MTLAIALLIGCADPGPELRSRPAGSEPAPVDTSTTPPAPSTELPTEPTFVWEPGPAVSPWASYVWDGSLDVYGNYTWISEVTATPDVTGDGLPDLFFNRPEFANVHSGLPAAGEHDLNLTGVAQLFDLGTRVIGYAGDLNADGVGDLWLAGSLYFGPITMETRHRKYTPDLMVPSGGTPFGNIDADGDGILDVAFAGSGLEVLVYYGPFDTTRDYNHQDCTECTFVHLSESCLGNDARWIGPVNHPDEMLVLVAGGLCPPYFLFDVRGPRGRDLWKEDVATAWIGHVQDPALNLRGDGMNDVVMNGTLFDTATGWLTPPSGSNNKSLLDGQGLKGGLGDLTGDGRGDLLANVPSPTWDVDEILYSVVLPGQPDLLAADARQLGVRLEQWVDRYTFIDLDGDDLVELIAYEGRRVDIYRGADIRQAMIDQGMLTPEGDVPPWP